MPIISKGGRKSWKIRFIFISMYTMLILGTITMLYPFLLMVSSSFATSFDFDDLKIVPDYLTSDSALLKKHLYAKYGQEAFREIGVIYNRDADWKTWGVFRKEKNFINKNFRDINIQYRKNPSVMRARVADFDEFVKTMPLEDVTAFYPDDFDAYRGFLRGKYEKIAAERSDKSSDESGIELLNRRWDRSFNDFSDIIPLKCFPLQQKWFPPKRVDFDDLLEFHRNLSPVKLKVTPVRLLWSLYLSNRFVSVPRFAEKTGLKYKQFSDIPIPKLSDNGALSVLWRDFLMKKYPFRLIGVAPDYSRQWRDYMKTQFKTIAAVNKQCGTTFHQFQDLKFPHSSPENPMLRSFWVDFVLSGACLNDWTLNKPVDLYRAFLKKKYKSIKALNKLYCANFSSFEKIKLPLKMADYLCFAENKQAIRRSFITTNYSKVLEFLFQKGRAVWVTILLVSLVILGALTVNPLAAYALSRGRQSTSSKFLIFFLATMAFPAEVAMIPGFLLLRDLNMLNTFAALVLPGLANGYSIFLLKGFFDSVPRELFEAADIDGANELQKFWSITFPMSKPILAVIALNAFKLAYGGFMWAFLTCQDPQMWTIMVWLYDFQGRYGSKPGMCMAAFVLASIPTLLVFLFCQKIIMRGIVIPTMK